MTFSSRTPPGLAPNRLTVELARMRRAGEALVDLTETNPTAVGLSYPPDLLEGLADGRGLVYEPAPFGLASARAAVADDLRRRGIAADPARIVLTASTSEAYSFLFKLLCDPGDEVLVPRPSYPLFEHLTRLDGVVPVPYWLEWDARWWLDLDRAARSVTDRTRALLLVNPNNPTGSVIDAGELDRAAALCRDRGLALISDEVFADYPLDVPRDAALTLAAAAGVLVFTLGGLSKSVGLPQAKLAWILASGPEGLVAPALERLEIIADTYLSVSTAVQHASRDLLSRGAAIRAQIGARIAANYAALRLASARYPACRVLPVQAGWSAVVQVPAVTPEEDLVLHLLREDRVVAHPGYFFDFASEAFLVFSLLPEPRSFEAGVSAALARAAGAA